ncbi:MAG: RND family efflux transporter MFP subunit [Zhongshania sp.]|jgi:RND family efflux transporter MFP subunit
MPQLLRRTLPFAILLFGIVLARVILGGPPVPKLIEVVPTPPQEARYRLIEPQTLPIKVSSYGKLSSRRQLSLTAEVSGRIIDTEPAYKVGNTVAANQALLSIDDTESKAESARAEARLADAEEQLASERGRVRQAKREWRELGSKEANALFLRKPQLRRAEATVDAAQAELKLAKHRLKLTKISAPFAAIIESTSADLGHYLNKGSAVATLLDLSTLEVILPVSPSQYRQLNFTAKALNKGIEITLHSHKLTIPATIRRTGATVDADSRLYNLIAEIDPKQFDINQSQLRIGEFLQADIPSAETSRVLAVPPTALFEQRYLRTIDADNKLRIIRADIAFSDEDHVYVLAPSAAVQRVIISGLATNIPGTPLRPVADSNAALTSVLAKSIDGEAAVETKPLPHEKSPERTDSDMVQGI